MNKLYIILISVLFCGISYAAQDTAVSDREVRDPKRLKVWLEANASDVETRVAAVETVVADITVVGADAASAGTGTITIQLKDAEGVNVSQQALVRTWIGTADDFGVDALTDYSVSTGVQKEEVTANGEYLAISDTNGVVVMAVDNGGAATNYAWASVEIGRAHV